MHLTPINVSFRSPIRIAAVWECETSSAASRRHMMISRTDFSETYCCCMCKFEVAFRTLVTILTCHVLVHRWFSAECRYVSELCSRTELLLSVSSVLVFPGARVLKPENWCGKPEVRSFWRSRRRTPGEKGGGRFIYGELARWVIWDATRTTANIPNVHRWKYSNLP